MGALNRAVNAVLRGFVAAFSWAGPAVSLTVVSILAGVAMLWVFRRTSDQAGIRAVKRKVHAYLLELRVYSDEPAMAWRTQKSLMRANGRYMALGLRPALWMAVPMVLLLIHLEAFYGRAPLPVGRDAVLTVALRPPDNGSVPELLLPPGVVLSAPPVRVLDGAEVSWRIRPVMPVSGQLRIRVGGEIFTKSIEAGGRPTFLAGRRTDSQLAALWYADEPPLGKGRVAWIDLPYPEARVGVFGVEVPWILWFIVVSMLAALALRKRFGVSL